MFDRQLVWHDQAIKQLAQLKLVNTISFGQYLKYFVKAFLLIDLEAQKRFLSVSGIVILIEIFLNLF